MHGGSWYLIRTIYAYDLLFISDSIYLVMKPGYEMRMNMEVDCRAGFWFTILRHVWYIKKSTLKEDI